MSDDLNNRVANILDALEVEPDEVAVCLAEVCNLLGETQIERERVQGVALDPGTSVVLAAKSRQTVSDLEFKALRLGVALDRLREKHQEATERVAQVAADKKKAATIARRDVVIERLKGEYLTRAGELATLLSEAQAVQVECTAAQVPGIGSFSHLLALARLPSLDPNSADLLFPVVQRVDVSACLPPEFLAFAHARGEHMRNVGARVAEAKAFEQTASRRKLG